MSEERGDAGEGGQCAQGGAIERVRECAGPECRALFLDTSRPGSRRWCSMDFCGNRVKKDAMRARTSRAGAVTGK